MNNDLIFHWTCDLKTREESPGALATLRHVGHHGLVFGNWNAITTFSSRLLFLLPSFKLTCIAGVLRGQRTII